MGRYKLVKCGLKLCAIRKKNKGGQNLKKWRESLAEQKNNKEHSISEEGNSRLGSKIELARPSSCAPENGPQLLPSSCHDHSEIIEEDIKEEPITFEDPLDSTFDDIFGDKNDERYEPAEEGAFTVDQPYLSELMEPFDEENEDPQRSGGHIHHEGKLPGAHLKSEVFVEQFPLMLSEKVGEILKFPITKPLLKTVKSSRSRYGEELKAKQELASVKKNTEENNELLMIEKKISNIKTSIELAEKAVSDGSDRLEKDLTRIPLDPAKLQADNALIQMGIHRKRKLVEELSGLKKRRAKLYKQNKN